MEGRPSQLTRHDVLVRALRVLAGLVVLAFSGRMREAAAAKALKEEAAYQDRPKDGKSCSSCRQFSPAAPGKGVCAVVEGEISVKGWCAAHSPRGAARLRDSAEKAAITQARSNRVRIAAVPSTAQTEEGVHT